MSNPAPTQSSQTGAPTIDPLREFRELFASAAEAAPFDATEVALATADEQGRPSVRIMLLKGVDERGFSFFTNYESRKGGELAANPYAALCWRWPWKDCQVRAEGPVERLSEAESDAYFASRPRGHQVGAWASAQSRSVASYAELEARVVAAEARFLGLEVPRPPYWGGFLLRPQALEFWHGRLNRLHERRVYRLVNGSWTAGMLSP